MEWVAHEVAGRAIGRAAERPRDTRARGSARQRSATFALTVPSAALVILNLLDGLFTLAFLQFGVAEEINPFMRWAYEANPIVFMVLKFLCVHAGVVVLAMHQELKAAQWVLKGAVGVYTLLVLYHLAFLAHTILR